MNYIETDGFERVIGPFKWIRLSIHHGWRLIRPSFTVSHKADAIRVIPTSQGVCFFTHLSGRFNGGGEFASIERGTVNGVEYWRLVLQHAGAEGAIRAHARCAAFAQR